MRQVSKKRSIQLREYSKLKKEYLKENNRCEICCKRCELDIHHRMGRVGDMLNKVGFWMAVCRSCHDRIHSNPRYSYQKGWLIK